MEFKLSRESEFVRKMVREFERDQMSNEEAIKKLEGLKKTHEDLYKEWHDEVFKDGIKALDIAIKELEKSGKLAEQLEDSAQKHKPTIREGAIRVLEMLRAEKPYKVPGKPETYCEYNEAWSYALDRAIRKLEEWGR